MKKRILPLMLLLIASTALLSSCKKKNEPEPAVTPVANTNTGAPSITSALYFQAKIDGTWVTFQEGGYTGSGSGSSGGSVPAGWQEEQDAVTFNMANSQGVSFFILKTTPSTPTISEIEAMFGIRSYPYGKRSGSTAVNGIDGAGFTYTDPSGTFWSTDDGTGNQTGSTFNIVENTVSVNGYAHRISKATFSCKLYDANGNTKTLTNGVYRGRSVYY